MSLETARKVLKTELEALRGLLERLVGPSFLSFRAERGTYL